MYSSYRQNILSLAQLTSLEHRAVLHREKGPRGEELFTDYFFSPPQKKTLVHLSGLHGVEGYLGSLIQEKILQQLASVKSFPMQIILVHAVNPYGMSWRRRTNHRNVDLNRNSLKIFDIPNPHYEKFAPFLNTKAGTDSLWELLDLMLGLYQIGFRQTVQAIACGQTEFPHSLFYAGQEAQAELLSLKAHLNELIPKDNEVFVLDVHSGLGKFAQESLIISGPDCPIEEEFVRTVLRSEPLIPGKSPGVYQAHGTMANLFHENWKSEKVRYLCQEFGTRSVFKVFRTLIQENYFSQWQPDLSEEEKKFQFVSVSQKMLDVFFPSEPAWRQSCVETGLLRFQQIIHANSPSSI